MKAHENSTLYIESINQSIGFAARNSTHSPGSNFYFKEKWQNIGTVLN